MGKIYFSPHASVIEEVAMIRFNWFMVFGIFLLCFLAINTSAFCAKEITEGMKQGEFAMVIIEKIDAQGLLPPAATTEDAFDFLKKLGLVPPEGWNREGIVDKNFLADLLGEKASERSFDDLVSKLVTKIAERVPSLQVKTISPTVE